MKPIPSALLAFTCCFLFCCKKQNKNSNGANSGDTVIYNFSYSGTPCINDTLSFNATEPAATVYQWSFGDGSNSAEATPSHQYADSGRYVVSLTLNGDTSRTISNTIIIYKDPIYTHLAAGERLWHYKHLDIWSGGYRDSSEGDKTLPIFYINAVTISFLGDTLIYVPSSSFGSTLVFTYYYNNFHSQQNSWGGNALTFNYVTDSIFFFSSDRPGPGEGLETQDEYHTE